MFLDKFLFFGAFNLLIVDDANGWKDMMSISKEIIKKLKFIKKDDFVVITAGLPFGKAGMTNMIRLYKVGT